MRDEGMDKIQKKILNKLLDLYEQSKTFRGTNQVNQTFGLKIEKMFPKYRDDTEYELFLAINESVEELKQRGLITVTYQKNIVIERITLNVEHIAECYQVLGRVPKKEEHRWLLDVWEQLCGRYQEEMYAPLIAYIQSQREKVRKNQKVEFYNGNQTEYQELITTVIQALENKEEIFIRDFSINIFHDSKRVEQLKSKAEALLFKYGDYEEKETVFEELGIVATPTYVMLKGNGEIRLSNQVIDLSQIRGDIALSTASLKELQGVNVLGNRVVTVENLTSFHDYPSADDFVIYLGGFHNKVKREFINYVYTQNSNKEYRHFGDIDAGGFYILEHLKRRTGIEFRSIYMSREVLTKYVDWNQPLTVNDRKRLGDLLVGLERRVRDNSLAEDYREVIAFMLGNDCKLEQEAVVVEDLEGIEKM